MSLSNLARTVLAIAHSRLKLLSVDFEEEMEHALSQLLLSLLALMLFGIGAVLASILLVVAFWDDHRLFSLGVLSGIFLTSGAATWLHMARVARNKPRVFAASLSEIGKDLELLVPPP